MTIEAKIICDSVGPNGKRITTFVLKYPRFIHAEFMTHRAFSRNASSSRAIPVNKQLEMIEDDLAMPLEFRKNQKGMQADEAIDNQDIAIAVWRNAADNALFSARKLADLGVHKQYVNRLVEPFAHISVVCTATEYSNFFALRHHSMAQPEIAKLAELMWEAYKANTPMILKAGEWHLPFVSEEKKTQYLIWWANCASTPEQYERRLNNVDWTPLIKSSVACCARTSYLNHDGTNSTYEQDAALYDRLLGEQPIHASPAEHQAKALPEFNVFNWGSEVETKHSTDETRSGNFVGWQQFRKTLEGENITEFNGPIG